jgi:glycosyltransferase involved in cell wall biosynthesis
VQIAVVLTTYNRPDALAAVLEGYLAQTDPAFAVVVADDGSAAATREVVERFRARAPFPLAHVWHEDRGFRAGAIRNRAVAGTDAPYLLFSDGDCVPVPDFVARHRALAEPGWFLVGHRVLLTERLSTRVLRDGLPVSRWGAGRWLRAWLARDLDRLLPLFRLPDLGAVRRLAPDRWEGAKSCNLSLWRSDFLAVNGFDESYAGWGLEDSDLVIRLLAAGIRRKSARFAAPVLHLWHPEQDRSALPENRRRLEAVLQSGRTAAVAGIDRYL